MAFGLAPAPRVFTKLLKVVVSSLRKQGMRLVIYLDDKLLLNESKEGIVSNTKTTIEILQLLGFLINWEKSVLIPSQRIEYLGLLVDSLALSFSLPDEKVMSVIKSCSDSIADGYVPLRRIAFILGYFTWAVPTLPFAQTIIVPCKNFTSNIPVKERGILTRCVIFWMRLGTT